ncbi:hypothetical protein ACEOWI_003932 [Bacillus cereus]
MISYFVKLGCRKCERGGRKTMFYEIIFLLDNRYNYHVLAKVLNVELQTLIKIKEHRNNFRIPGNH